VGSDGAVIQLVTRCHSAAEFIDRFARFTTQTDLMVPVLPHVKLGTAGQFVICLQDRSVIMQGRCEVTQIQPGAGAAAGPLGRGLMRLRLREMDASSWGVHMRLMERQASAAAPPPSPPARPLRIVPPPATEPAPVVAVPQVAAAVVLAVAHAPETQRTEISPAPRVETRAPGASFTLPANPLSDLDAADLASFIELTLLETSGDAGAGSSERGPAGAPAAARSPADQRARRVARRALPYAACVLIGLLPGLALRFVPRRPAMPAPGAPRAPEPAAVSAPIGPPLPPASAAPPPRGCTADVTTRPLGAAVFWGDTALGTTPIEHAAVPCGAAVVTFRHERYAALTRTLEVAPGDSTAVAERLYRPPARLTISSSPARAVITVNRRRVGRAPRTISTLQFEHLRIEASAPGYRPWKKTLYLKEGDSSVDVTLAPVTARRNARRPM
jgi:hypothetical protein